MGEIHTGILQNSVAVTVEIMRDLAAVIPQQPIQVWERPIRQVASPDVLTGLDCAVPSAGGARIRGIGTVGTQVRLTGGRLLQACTRTELVTSPTGRRMSWSYYLARPARVELIGRWSGRDVAGGFLTGSPGAVFDLGGVCSQWMSRIQASPELDRRVPVTARRTRFRWAADAVPAGAPGRVDLRLEGDDLRTLRLQVPERLLDRVPELCRDLALHDWLLSSLISLVDRAGIGSRERAEVVRRLGPTIDHLLHTWMPAARLDDELVGYWTEIERRSGLSRQWENLVRLVRDQVALAGLDRPEKRIP